MLAAAVLAALLTGCTDDTSSGPPGAPARPTTSTTSTTSTTLPGTTAPTPDPSPFAGPGAWVDVFDYVPAFAGPDPTVDPGTVTDMAAAGVRTLYLQTGRDDPRSPEPLAHEGLLARFLTRAHDAGLAVVGWYLPTHRDPEVDLERVRAIARFEAGGRGFDGVALDIEWTEGVADVDERNARLLALAGSAERLVAPRPLGAIVFPPVVLDELAVDLWPRFPWRGLAPHVDVWLPMAYWTFRDDGTAYRDAFRYTTANVERTARHVGGAPVHVVGGVADEFAAGDVAGFARAVEALAPFGWSVYDWATLAPAERRTFAGIAP